MSASEICIFLISSVIVFVKYFLVSFVNLIPLLVVEEHCIRDEAKAKAKVDLIQERMLA